MGVGGKRHRRGAKWWIGRGKGMHGVVLAKSWIGGVEMVILFIEVRSDVRCPAAGRRCGPLEKEAEFACLMSGVDGPVEEL